MSDRQQPTRATSSSTEHSGPADNDKAGGANLGDTTATQKSATREETIAELKAEFQSFEPSEFPRELDENDMEWQRTGGAPEK